MDGFYPTCPMGISDCQCLFMQASSSIYPTNLVNSIWTWVRLVTCSTLAKQQQHDVSWPTKPWNPSTSICWEFFGEIVHQTFDSNVDDFLVDIEYKHQHVDAILHHPTSKIPFRKWLFTLSLRRSLPILNTIHYPHFFFSSTFSFLWQNMLSSTMWP